MKRFGILMTLSMVASLVAASPVLAAAPGNDLYSGRTVIGALPFFETIDTTEATTDADDVEANPPLTCGAPATDASVWYEFTAATDAELLVDLSGSDYSTGVIVATGSPGSFALVTCGPGVAFFPVIAGETYAILAFDYQGDGGGNGGTLQIMLDEIPPPPDVVVTVDPMGTFNASTGSATVSGTITCTGLADKGFIDVQLRQTVGRIVISGNGFASFTCDGTTQPWSAEVFSESGLFKGGKASSVTFAGACSRFGCDDDVVERVVQLRR